MKNIFLHFNFGYSFYTGASVLSLIKDRLPATLSLDRRRRHALADDGDPGRDHLGRSGAARCLDRTAMGIALVFVSMPVFWLGLVVLFLFADDIGQFHVFPGANSYVGLTVRPGAMVHLADPALVRAGRDLGGDLLPRAARQPARGDGRGLHPHRARQGPDASAESSGATACARRSRRW